ncbi:MAG: DNA translocase FtsK 4TM domain-containing protein, partial [Rubrivivax sp.]
MSFPLGSLRADGADARLPGASAPWRAGRRGGLLLLGAAVLWLLAVLALLTHGAADPGFSTSGAGGAVRNRAGSIGAWASDLALFLFGFSVWWLVLAAARQWLGALARRLRGEPATPPPWQERALFWGGLVLLLGASCALEWTRLYRLEPHLPGPAGGVLGHALGPLSMRTLGFAGSGVVWVAALIAGLSLTFGFSWLSVAERIGSFLDSLRERRAERREIAEDQRIGEQAQREREQDVQELRQTSQDLPPIVIEPPMLEVPRSERVAKERQKPLFAELSDTRLPQVDLLDAAGTRQESVTAESLEMTSRLIEKKLGDFGVVVRVVAASPGPVITRYEIEPDTGVKGSQIVNLAKDLARSLSLVSIRVVETIPGKTTMALELPNARRQAIRLAEILGSQAYNDAASMLTIGLGKDIVGQPMVADLARMPHCLVAGTTGSGKSVGINA